jgi:hypothetical protein
VGALEAEPAMPDEHLANSFPASVFTAVALNYRIAHFFRFAPTRFVVAFVGDVFVFTAPFLGAFLFKSVLFAVLVARILARACLALDRPFNPRVVASGATPSARGRSCCVAGFSCPRAMGHASARDTAASAPDASTRYDRFA